MISEANDWYWRRVARAASVPDASLGVFRWIFGLFFLLVSAPHFAWIDDVPRALFTPPVFSLTMLIGSFPPAPALMVLDIVSLTALLAVTIGWKTRLTTPFLAVCLFIGTSFGSSFGKTDGTLIIALLLCMTMADWGRHHSWDARNTPPADDGSESSRSTQRGLALFATLLAFGFLTAGIPKFINWADGDLATSGVLDWYYGNRLSLGRAFLLSDYVPGTPALVLELADYAAIAMELVGFIALLAGRRTWMGYLLVLTLFHLANALILNIAFNGQVVTYVVFANLCFLAPLLDRRAVRVGATTVAVAATGWHVVARLGDFESQTVLVSTFTSHLEIGLYLSVPLCIAVAFLFALEIRKGKPKQRVPDDAAAVGSPG